MNANNTLKKRLVGYLSLCDRFVPKETIVEVAKRAYQTEQRSITSEYINRTLRELAEDGEITKDDTGKYVLYAPLGKEKPLKKTQKVEIVNGTARISYV